MISHSPKKKQLINSPCSMMSNQINHIARFKTNSKTENLENIRKFVFEYSKNFGFNSYKSEELVLAVDEACTNLIKHAYKYNTDDTIIVELKSIDNNFLVSIIDNSPSFDPRLVQNPDLVQYKQECRKGGLGIFIMKSLVDSVDYEVSKNGNHRNILTLTKQLA